MAYWPPASFTKDTRTATFSLALDATHEKNGALKFIPGSHKAKTVRPHVPIGKTQAPPPAAGTMQPPVT